LCCRCVAFISLNLTSPVPTAASFTHSRTCPFGHICVEYSSRIVCNQVPARTTPSPPVSCTASRVHVAPDKTTHQNTVAQCTDPLSNQEHTPVTDYQKTQTSPQQQRSFSSSYASSPISTPSRVLNYSIPSPSPSRFNVSINSSASLPPSPSPILSAFRGKQPTYVGRTWLS